MNRTQTQWTLVSLRKRAHYARPVANAPIGTWLMAHDVAAVLVSYLPADESTMVWYVPTHDETLLTDSGRRVPIRWDAASDVTTYEGPVIEARAWSAWGEHNWRAWGEEK